MGEKHDTETTYLHVYRQCLGGGGTLCCIHFRDKKKLFLFACHRLGFAHFMGDLSDPEDFIL
jgi:hypothetical protein